MAKSKPKEGPPDPTIMDAWWRARDAMTLRGRHDYEHGSAQQRAHSRLTRLAYAFEQPTIEWIARQRDCDGKAISITSLAFLTGLSPDGLKTAVEHWRKTGCSSRELDAYVRDLRGVQRLDASVLMRIVPGMVKRIDNLALPAEWKSSLVPVHLKKLRTELRKIRDWSAGLLAELG